MGVAKSQDDVGEEVEGAPAEQGGGVDCIERLVNVGEDLVDTEGGDDDAGDHREVEVGIRVAGEGVAVRSFGGLHEAAFGDDGDDVEVDPPKRGGEADAEDGGEHDRSGELDVSAGADRDDGLAEGEDDHEVVPLGEVSGHELPVLDARQCW